MTDSEQTAGAGRVKVLYVEDQEVNVTLVESLLAELPGVTLLIARTGAEGVRMARSEQPDLVLLDMHLPDFGGLEVVRALSVEISKGLTIIILTADSLSIDVVKAMSLGAVEYWVKPIVPQRLLEGVSRRLRPATGTHAGSR